MKKVLLIGDLRTATDNYGAVANSENLIDKLTSSNVELRCIDNRSFFNETPEAGWVLNAEEWIKSANDTNLKSQFFDTVKKILKKIPGITSFVRNIKDKEVKPFVPYCLKLYKEYSERVKNGSSLQYEKKLIEWADMIIINGEGNIVRGTDKYGYYRMGGLYVLFMAYLSKEIFCKPTFIINHTIDPGNRDAKEIICNVYPKLDGVYIRENLSIKLLKSWGINNVKMIPDSLFLYGLRHENLEYPHCYKEWRNKDKKLICIGDSSGIENKYSKVKWNVKKFYSSLIQQILEKGFQVAFVDGFNGNNDDLNYVCKHNDVLHLKMANCSYKELYNILGEAEIYVPGRWHTSILALQAKTPIILWGADSHKTEALYELIDYSYKFFDVNTLPVHIQDICDEAMKIISSDNGVIFSNVKRLMEKAENISEVWEN